MRTACLYASRRSRCTSGFLGIGDEVKVVTISLQFLLSMLDNCTLPLSLWPILSAIELKNSPDLLCLEVILDVNFLYWTVPPSSTWLSTGRRLKSFTRGRSLSRSFPMSARATVTAIVYVEMPWYRRSESELTHCNSLTHQDFSIRGLCLPKPSHTSQDTFPARTCSGSGRDCDTFLFWPDPVLNQGSSQGPKLLSLQTLIRNRHCRDSGDVLGP